MGSSRLPGKSLADLGGRPALAFMLDRLRRAQTLDALVVATTTAVQDDELADVARAAGAQVVRGSEDDVLSRYAQAARESGASTVVRLTADCPLVDAAVVDRTVEEFVAAPPDVSLVTNAPPHGRTYPDGMDVEVLSRATLDGLAARATRREHREHPTSLLHADGSIVRELHLARDLGHVRITVDLPEDLARVREIVDCFGHDGFAMDDLLVLLECAT